MIQPSHHRTTPLAARLVALLLVCAFVLQSAAQAGRGCLARVFTGECCCAAADTAAPAHACCARSSAEAPADSPDEPRFESQKGCACSTALQPIAPAAPRSPDVTTERSWERILHAQPIASPVCASASILQHVEQRALDRPPRPARTPAASFTCTRLAQRGVSGLLSELCTLLR